MKLELKKLQERTEKPPRDQFEVKSNYVFRDDFFNIVSLVDSALRVHRLDI